MIHYVTGDLFANQYHARAFAHGCNTQGVMGAGIAKEFKRRWPAMYETYRLECQTGRFLPGKALLCLTSGNIGSVIFCLATQNYPGPTARYKWLEMALCQMLELCDAHSIASVAMPAIGCGIGGLQWPDVQGHIDTVFDGWDGDLYVYEPR